jgi:imidazolonepropionase-like amidohydrolase
VWSLAPGLDADIVLFENDPLRGLDKPAAVFLGGVRVR